MKIQRSVLVPCLQRCHQWGQPGLVACRGHSQPLPAVPLCWHFPARGNPEPAVVSPCYHQQHAPLPSASPVSSWSFLGTQYPSVRSFAGLLPVDVRCHCPLIPVLEEAVDSQLHFPTAFMTPKMSVPPQSNFLFSSQKKHTPFHNSWYRNCNVTLIIPDSSWNDSMIPFFRSFSVLPCTSETRRQEQYRVLRGQLDHSYRAVMLFSHFPFCSFHNFPLKSNLFFWQLLSTDLFFFRLSMIRPKVSLLSCNRRVRDNYFLCKFRIIFFHLHHFIYIKFYLPFYFLVS